MYRSLIIFICIVLKIIDLVFVIDIEETEFENVSEGSADDLEIVDDTLYFDFSFSSSNTDSLPFTIYDTSRTVTRKSHHV